MAACEPAFKVFGQVTSRAITRTWFALQTFCTNGFQIAVERWGKRAQFRRGFFGGLLDNSKRVLAQEWRPAGEKFEQDRAQTVNVGRRGQIGSRSPGLLRRNVTGRAENSHCVGEITCGVEPFGQTEIAHQRFVSPVQQNVSWFEIAMQDSV